MVSLTSLSPALCPRERLASLASRSPALSRVTGVYVTGCSFFVGFGRSFSVWLNGSSVEYSHYFRFFLSLRAFGASSLSRSCGWGSTFGWYTAVEPSTCFFSVTGLRSKALRRSSGFGFQLISCEEVTILLLVGGGIWVHEGLSQETILLLVGGGVWVHEGPCVWAADPFSCCPLFEFQVLILCFGFSWSLAVCCRCVISGFCLCVCFSFGVVVSAGLVPVRLWFRPIWFVVSSSLWFLWFQFVLIQVLWKLSFDCRLRGVRYVLVFVVLVLLVVWFIINFIKYHKS